MYEKPMFFTTDDFAEGIYLTSGDTATNNSGCYTATAYIHQKPQPGSDVYRIQVNGVHKADHTRDAQVLHISFNQPVTYNSSNGQLVSGNGTSTLEIAYTYHQNPNDNIGLGDLVVSSNDGLAITAVSITDSITD